jgi:hypothetical protein
MGRTKQPRVSAPSAGPSEEKLREAALLLNLPLANLQSLLSGTVASNLSLPSEGQQQSVLQAEPDEVDIDGECLSTSSFFPQTAPQTPRC